MSLFSTCIITASDENQAKVFRNLIERRRDKGLYPREIDFRVYADPPGGRVGSGGGSLWALDRWLTDLGSDSPAERRATLDSRSVLMIHAGGQSRRLPSYVPEGKLFAPVPAPSSSVLSPVVFDLELSLYLRYPWRAGELVIASGDVIVDFATESLVLPDAALCGFAAASSFEEGSLHGVYVFDPRTGSVTDFIQKAPPAELSARARIEGSNSCALDLGIVSFRGAALGALLALLDARPAPTLDAAGTTAAAGAAPSIRASLAKGALNFDLYVELLSAALSDLDLPAFLARIAPQSVLPPAVAEELWRAIHPCGLGGVLVRNPTFIHFGSLAEYPGACRETVARGIAPFYALQHEELRPDIDDRRIIANSVRVNVAAQGPGLFVENCVDLSLACEGDNLLVGLRDFTLSETLPRGFCLDERRLAPAPALAGRPVTATGHGPSNTGARAAPETIRLVHHRLDSFKTLRDPEALMYCGVPLSRWLAERDLTFGDIFPNAPGAPHAADQPHAGQPRTADQLHVDQPHTGAQPHTFDPYEAALYLPGADPAFLAGYWRKPDDTAAWSRRFKAAPRLSLASINAASDAVLRDEERRANRTVELRDAIARSGLSSISASDFVEVLKGEAPSPALEKACAETNDPLLKRYRAALLAAAQPAAPRAATQARSAAAATSKAPAAAPPPSLQAAARASQPAPLATTRTSTPPPSIQPATTQTAAPQSHLSCAVKLDQIVWARAPLRFDLAGGWTDTPPYTNRFGGAVVNLAVDLNGQSPVQVFIRRSAEPILRFHSIDLGITETIPNLRSLRAYQDPSGAFSMPRAALCLLGLGAGRPDGESLETLLRPIGGGLEITLLSAVPKGSGLGTSSVLAGAITAALCRFFGIERSPDDLYNDVLELEQMLTTGGGWQDQVGGLVGGVKYIESRAGLRPRLAIHQLDAMLYEDRKYHDQMTLFYTGVTRLAKNILGEVVARVDGMERSFLFTHGRLRELALEAREALSLRDLHRLAAVVDASFAENRLIHASTTNAEIEALVAAARPHISGMKLLGAGGGGFAYFISPDRRQAELLRELLEERFADDRARLVDFSLSRAGLQVTVS